MAVVWICGGLGFLSIFLFLDMALKELSGRALVVVVVRVLVVVVLYGQYVMMPHLTL